MASSATASSSSPASSPTTARCIVHARGNLSLDEKDRLVAEVEKRVLTSDGLKTVYTRVGEQPRGSSEITEDTIGVIQFEFADWRTRPPAHVIMDEIRDEDRRHPRHPGRGDGAARRPADRQADPGAARPRSIRRCCRPPPRRSPRCWRTRRDIRDLDDGLPLPGIDWKIEVDKAEAAKYGAGVNTVGTAVQLVTNGLKVTEYRPADSDKAVDILVRFPRGPPQPRPDRRAAHPDAGRLRADRQFRHARAGAARRLHQPRQRQPRDDGVGQHRRRRADRRGAAGDRRRARQGRSRRRRHLQAQGRGRGARQGRRLPAARRSAPRSS